MVITVDLANDDMHNVLNCVDFPHFKVNMFSMFFSAINCWKDKTGNDVIFVKKWHESTEKFGLNNKIDDKGSTIIEVSEEDTKKNDDPTQDEEYKRIKSTCEFFTREECQKALPDIQLKYLDDEHDMVSASCKSFAYKGQIVGYRVLLTYGDGKFFYNN